MLPINYHHLYYFRATARAGSLSRAARELPLSQPALSLQLRQLERSIGGKLFERGRTGITLTPLGSIVFDHCERIFSAGDALTALLKRGGVEAAPVRLGSSLSVPREALLRAVDAAAEGGTRVEIFTGPRAEVRERLARRALDAALCDVDLSPQLGRDFRGVLLGGFPIRLVAAPRLRARLSAHASEPMPMLMRPPESPARKAVGVYLAEKNIRYTLGAETEDSELLRVLALRGRGVAGLSSLSCDEDIAAGKLAAVVKSVGPRDHVWLVAPAQLAAPGTVAAALARLEALKL